MGSKNNPQARGKVQVKFAKNTAGEIKKIEPIQYIGREERYIAAKFSKTDIMLMDSNSRPIPWSEVKSEEEVK